MQILGLVGCKSLTLAVYCFSSWFVHQELKTYSALFVLCRLCHLAWFQGIKYIQPSFRPQVTNHDVKSKTLNKLFLRSSLFSQLFHDAEKLRRKAKTFVKVKSNPRPNKCSTHQSWKRDNIFLLRLRVWLFGGLAETSLNQFEQKLPKKIPFTETRIYHPPKQVHITSRCHMTDK